MMYVRYPLSLRNVEDLLFERGIDICRRQADLPNVGCGSEADVGAGPASGPSELRLRGKADMAMLNCTGRRSSNDRLLPPADVSENRLPSSGSRHSPALSQPLGFGKGTGVAA